MPWWWWAWQSMISIGVFIVIQMNGRGWIHGWLCGFLVQALQVGYAVATQSWGYLLAALPGAAFLHVWLTKRREQHQR
jgi:hypothetical protein